LFIRADYPAIKNPASLQRRDNGFPALRAPICFASGLMTPAQQLLGPYPSCTACAVSREDHDIDFVQKADSE